MTNRFTESPPSSWNRKWFPGLLLAAVTFIVFWPALGCDFVNYDDPAYVASNTHVLRGLTRDGIAWAFQTAHMGYWHPLTWLSLMLDVTLFGRGAGGLHLTNVLLHAANSLLLFVLLRRWTGALWRSAMVAALFALHPLHVESVAWVTERKDVLSTLFWLLTLWAYGRFVQKSEAGSRRSEAGTLPSALRPPTSVLRPLSSGSYWLALLFFALGLMSKPMLVTLPFVMLLLDYWPLQRMDLPTLKRRPAVFLRLVAEKVPFFVLGILSSWITFRGQKAMGVVVTLTNMPVFDRIETAFVSYAQYLGQTFWPLNLAVCYPPAGPLPMGQVAGAMALVIGLCLGAIWAGRKWPYILAGWFWFFGTLIPVIGLIRVGNQFRADRFTYVPLIGLFIMLVWGASGAIRRWLPSRGGGMLMRVAAGVVLTACALRTRDQLQYWQDSETLFRHAIAVTENNRVAYENLASHLAGKGRVNEAIDWYHAALRIDPNRAEGYTSLGGALTLKGDLDEAILNYERALRLAPDSADTYNNLGYAMAAKGRVDEAIECYRKAIRINPDAASPYYNLGLALAGKGRNDEAIECYRKTLQINPDRPKVHFNLGRLLARLGRRDEAAAHLEEALRLKPDYTEASELLKEIGTPEQP